MGYFDDQLQAYCSLPPKSGKKDPALRSLAASLDLSEARVLLDYGCGRGRLLAALRAERKPRELRKLSYVGVDAHRASLRRAERYFDEHLAATGMRAVFCTTGELPAEAMVFDDIVLVFCLHEIDPLNLDHEIEGLWRMLRRGGHLHIQDSADPIHREIEFLAFTPDQISALLRPLTSETAHTSMNIGRSGRVGVFHLEATKPEKGMSFVPSLSTTYREVLHASLLSICFDLHVERHRFERGENVGADDLAALCHQAAVRARAYHQSLAFDEVRAGSRYCVSCGSNDVVVEDDPGDLKSTPSAEIACRTCAYTHLAGDEARGHTFESGYAQYFRWVHRGSSSDDSSQRYFLDWAASHLPGEFRAVGREILRRVPGVSRSEIDDALARNEPPLLYDWFEA